MWRSIVWNLDSEWDCTKLWCCGYTAELLSRCLSLPRLLTCKIGSLSAENPSRDRCTNHRYYLGKCLPVVTTPPNAMSRCCYHRNDGRKLAISLTVYEFPWNVFKTPWAISYLFYSLKLPVNIQGFFQPWKHKASRIFLSNLCLSSWSKVVLELFEIRQTRAVWSQLACHRTSYIISI